MNMDMDMDTDTDTDTDLHTQTYKIHIIHIYGHLNKSTKINNHKETQTLAHTHALIHSIGTILLLLLSSLL